MTKAQHTPGAWTINADDGDSIGMLGNNGHNSRGQQYIAAIQYSDKAQKDYLPLTPSHEEAKANAHLIAAAPELLEALQRCEKEITKWCGKVNKIALDFDCPAMLIQARAVIAKAKGE